MPELAFQVPDFNVSVINHVAAQVIQAMLKDLTLTTIFNDNNTTILNDHMADANSSDGENALRIASSDRCDVTVTEVTNPAKIRWDILNFSNIQAYGQSTRDHMDMIPLFTDHTANISVMEYDKPCNIRLDFSLKFRDKAEATRVESVITNRYHASSRYNPHDIAYSYQLGLDLTTALFVLYKLRTSYNLTHEFVTYLRDFATQAIEFEVSKPVLNVTDERRLVVKHVSLLALGLLEYDQEKPTPVTMQRITDRWELQFSYTLQFARPDTLRLQFPSVVENTWVPAEILPDLEPESHLFLRQIEGLIRQTSFNHAMRRFSRRPNLLIRLPYYDNFQPPINGPVGVHGYKPFLISAFTLDEGGTSIDLKNLGDIDLDPTVIELMELHTGNDLLTTIGLFNVSVYSNGMLVNPTRLAIDEDLVITVDATALGQRYHLVISEATRILQLDIKYLTMLVSYRWFFGAMVVRHLAALTSSGYLKPFPSDEALELFDRLFKSGQMEVYITELIDEGHATHYLRRVATSAYTLLEYMLVKVSPVARIYLYDVLIQKFLTDAVILAAPRAPSMYTHNGIPLHHLMESEGYGYSAPLRVSLARIIT